MEKLMAFNDWLNGIVWGPAMITLLVGTGIYLTFANGFIQVVKFPYIFRNTMGKMFDKGQRGEGDITPFQAAMTALSAIVGTGNIAGVATAITLGGPGAIFWMWVSAFFGMSTKFTEITLAVHYREKKADGSWAGGPMYYLSKGLHSKFLAVAFAFATLFAALGMASLVDSNTVALTVEHTFGIAPWITGIILMGATGAVVIGGIKRIGKVCEKIGPFMAAFYIIGALIIILMNIDKVPAAFSLILTSAFNPSALGGGFAGATILRAMKFGVARGIFSNEAGLGSTPMTHSSAQTDHPVRQGMWGVTEVFMDTIVICTITALVILLTGVWDCGESGGALAIVAFDKGLPGMGKYIVVGGVVLFAYSSLISWIFYGEKSLEFLVGGPQFTLYYKIIWVAFIMVGCLGGLEFIWSLADTLNGFMAIPNLIGLIFLSRTVLKLKREFFTQIALWE